MHPKRPGRNIFLHIKNFFRTQNFKTKNSQIRSLRSLRNKEIFKICQNLLCTPPYPLILDNVGGVLVTCHMLTCTSNVPKPS